MTFSIPAAIQYEFKELGSKKNSIPCQWTVKNMWCFIATLYRKQGIGLQHSDFFWKEPYSVMRPNIKIHLLIRTHYPSSGWSMNVAGLWFIGGNYTKSCATQSVIFNYFKQSFSKSLWSGNIIRKWFPRNLRMDKLKKWIFNCAVYPSSAHAWFRQIQPSGKYRQDSSIHFKVDSTKFIH